MRVVLPYKLLLEDKSVMKIVAESPYGSFGILPNRLDFVSAVVPGIVSYQTTENSELFLAVDQGVILKTGDRVWLAVHQAVTGTELKDLHKIVEREFLKKSNEEVDLKLNLAKLEMDFIRRFSELTEEK